MSKYASIGGSVTGAPTTGRKALKHDKDYQTIKHSGPTVHTSEDALEDLEIDYSVRSATDFVVSGPIAQRGGGPGRNFPTADEAEAWAHEYYGNRYKRRITDAERGGRWAILVSKIG